MSRIQAPLASKIVEQVRVVDDNGNVRVAPSWVVNPEEDEQIRQGYRCPFDMQVFQEAFPTECPICKLTPSRAWFNPRKHQADVYAKQYLGERHFGPSDDGFDYDADGWKPTTSVLIPGRDF